MSMELRSAASLCDPLNLRESVRAQFDSDDDTSHDEREHNPSLATSHLPINFRQLGCTIVSASASIVCIDSFARFAETKRGSFKGNFNDSILMQSRFRKSSC